MVQSKQKGKRGDIVALKGKTTFELTDVNTGEVEVVEDTNMITNGLQEFLTTYGYFGCDVLSDDTVRTNSLWVNLLGGLFLFDSTIEENVANTFMPAGVKMIGNGSKDYANSGAVTELGSYNNTESGLQSDGSIKLVYDFSTQQANGTISCACLTSKIGGYMGVGNESASYIDRNYSADRFITDSSCLCYSGISGEEKDSNHFLYPVYSENAIYFTNPYNITYSSSYSAQHWSATGKIQILKVRGEFSSVGIKDSKYIKQVMETYDIDIPQDILTYMGANTKQVIAIADSCERNIYIIFSKSTAYSQVLSTNGYCWIMKIDKNMNATAYRLTNNTGYNLYLTREQIVFDGDYMWLWRYTNPYSIVGIKYSDSTQIIETVITDSSTRNLYNICKNLIGIYSSASKAPTVYDVVNNTHKVVNGYFENSSGYLLTPFSDKKGVYIYSYAPSGSSGACNYRVMKDPRYLATINNLSEPVVKTASKTMKVTYTITEA